jgi:hypothetical protein
VLEVDEERMEASVARDVDYFGGGYEFYSEGLLFKVLVSNLVQVWILIVVVAGCGDGGKVRTRHTLPWLARLMRLFGNVDEAMIPISDISDTYTE